MRKRPTWILRFALATLFLSFYSGCSRRPAFKHVILFIGDGMSLESEIAASRYLYGKDRALAWHSLPGQSYVSTWDVTAYNSNARKARRAAYSDAVFAPSLGYDVRQEGDRPYPDKGRFEVGFPVSKPAADSASAATALATGIKTASGNIAWRPGDKSWGGLPTIAEEFRGRSGGAIGIVTTVPFSHATPAAFVSHNTSRNHYYTGYKGYTGLGIADEIILCVKPEVVIGGGNPAFENPGFDTDKGSLSEDLYKTLQSSTEYVLAERQADVDGVRTLDEAAEKALSQGKKLFGLFGGKDGNFEPRLPENSPGSPKFERETSEDLSLKDATLAALRVLSRDPDGFFLMAEQGDIDWANHDNDFRGLIGAMCDLEDAVRSAVAFVDRPGDDIDWTNTVLLVTADHATGGLRLNPAKPLGLGQLPVQIARAKEEETAKPANGNGRHPAPAPPAVPVFRSPQIYPDGEVSYWTIGHTNELVTLAVSGSAAPLFLEYEGWWYPGPIVDNTQVNAGMREALGLGVLNAVAVSNGVPAVAPDPPALAGRK